MIARVGCGESHSHPRHDAISATAKHSAHCHATGVGARLPLSQDASSGLDARGSGRRASAVLANTHLFFLIAVAPCVLLFTTPAGGSEANLLVPLAIAVGWFLTPYALHWREIFALNFAPNAHLLARRGDQ